MRWRWFFRTQLAAFLAIVLLRHDLSQLADASFVLAPHDGSSFSEAYIGSFAHKFNPGNACKDCRNAQVFPADPSSPQPLACYQDGRKYQSNFPPVASGQKWAPDLANLNITLPKQQVTIEAWIKFDSTTFDQRSSILDILSCYQGSTVKTDNYQYGLRFGVYGSSFSLGMSTTTGSAGGMMFNLAATSPPLNFFRPNTW